MPGWAWAIIIPGGIGALCVLACGGCLLSGAWMSNTAASLQRQEEANAIQLTPGVEHRIGDVGITVVGCREEVIWGVTPSGREYFSEKPHTVVELRLKNYNPAKNADIHPQTGAAKVTDDLGNNLDASILRAEDSGWPCRLRGQIEEGKYLSLRSDSEPAKDALIVERTVPAAKKVKVLLDASKYGGRGYLSAELPIQGKD
jgi:hypothetical protein